MKKLTTALLGATLLLSPAAFAQNEQLPNNGFEDVWENCVPWTSNNNSNAQGTTPKPWTISNTIGTGSMGKTTVGEKVEGYNSSSAVKLTNKSILGNNIPAYLTLGTPWSTSVGMGNQKDGGTFDGYAFTSRPDAIEFMYKSSRANGSTEKSTVIAYLWKGHWDQSEVPGNIVLSGNPTTVTLRDRDRCILNQYYIDNHNQELINNETKGGTITPVENAELIAVAEMSFGGTTVNEWTLCHVDFKYLTESIPENINVIFAAGDYFNTNVIKDNSLTVDDVKLIYYPREIHEGYLNIDMLGEKLTTDQDSHISIVNKSATKCDFTLPDFTLKMGDDLLPLGDINVPDVTITEENGVKTYNGTVKDLSLLEGGIIADATVSGTIDADNFVNMKIDVLWTNTGGDLTPIDVTFTTNSHPVAPTLQIGGKDIKENEPITVKDGEVVTLPMADGIEIWYALEETSSAAAASYAPSRIPTDKNYTLYDGSALDIESGKNYNLTYIAKDTKTGMESEPKTVSISTTTGIAAIEAENGTAEYFTLQGVRVAEPTNGIYIRVANGKATKVTVK